MKWNTVLLSGPVGEYRPLLDHLMASPDWHLAFVTNYGFLFRYGSGLPPRSLDAAFRRGPDQETAVYLAQIAGYYDAIRRTADARACIERALELAPDNTSVLSHAATFAAAQKRWQDAIGYSRRALENDHGLIHAKLIQALALLETGEAEKAEELVDDVLTRIPGRYLYPLSVRPNSTVSQRLRRRGRIARKACRRWRTRPALRPPTIGSTLGRPTRDRDSQNPPCETIAPRSKADNLMREQSEEVRDAIKSIESKTAP